MKTKCRLFAIMMLQFFFQFVFAQEINYKDSLELYNSKADYEIAKTFGEKWVEKMHVLGQDSLDYAIATSELGSVYKALGKFHLADSLFKITLIIQKIKLGESNKDYAITLINMGELYGDMGNFIDAERCESKAMRLFRDLKIESEEYVDLLNNIALHNQNNGNYDSAKIYYLLALDLQENKFGRDKPVYSTILNNLGVLAYKSGNYKETEKYFRTSLEYKKKATPVNLADIAYSLGNFTTFYIRMGNYEAAEPLIKEAIKIRKKTIGENHPEYAASLSTYANILRFKKDYIHADSLYLESIKIIKSSLLETHPYYTAALLNLATAYTQQNNFGEADSLYNEVLNILKKQSGDNTIEYALANRSLGRLYYLIGKYDTAISIFSKTLNIFEKALEKTNPVFINTRVYLAQILLAMQNPKEASPYIQSAVALERELLIDKLDFMSEIEMIAYFNDERQQTFDLPFSLLWHINSSSILEFAYNNRMLINGIAILNTGSLYTQMNQSTDTATGRLYKNYRSNKSLLSKTLSQPIAKRIVNTDSLNELANQQEKDLLSQSAIYRDMKSNLNTTWQDVRNNLKPTEAAIEFVKFNSLKRNYKEQDTVYYAAMLLRPQDTVPVFVKLFEESQLKNTFKSFVYTAQQQLRGSGESAKTAPVYAKNYQQSIYQLLWKPLEKYLSNTKTVYFSPDGLLHQISFAAIPYKNGLLLCDRYNLVQVTLTRQVAIKDDNDKAPASIALFGGINYNRQQADTGIAASPDPYQYVYQQNRNVGLDSFNYLPNTLKEVADINTAMKAKQKLVVSFVGDRATEAAFRSLGGPKSPRVIHIATHGFTLPDDTSKNKTGENVFKVSDNPLLRTGLVMAGGNKGWKGSAGINEDDGILTALEISAINLQNTELVVLSACETGIGELHGSEGVFGLQRAFKLAGVKYIMASLWSVPDRETGIFMNDFYNNWIIGGNIQQAFITTQRNMQKKKYAPYYWAGFTLVH